MKLLVTGVTRTGNLGGTAMLCAVEEILGNHVEDFALASILPKRDRAQNGPDRARIVDAGYRYWLLVAAPLCLVLWPMRRFSAIRFLLARLPLLKDFHAADAVVDLSGICFVDGRGLALLFYNVAVVLPALFFDTPVYKLSQATGPFKQRLNRMLARAVLGRCRTVVARGGISLRHLLELGIGHAVHRQDTSFALTVSEADRSEARKRLTKGGVGGVSGPLVVFSPSAVVAARCQRSGLDMAAIMTRAIHMLAHKGVAVALLPHATDTGIRKNDDNSVARQIHGLARQLGVEVPILDPSGDPRLARALAGEANVFIASRFHSMVAALSQGVPTLTIGWSHKDAEAAAPFAMDRFTIDYSSLDASRIVAMVEDLLRDEAALKVAMGEAALAARQSAIEGIEIVMEPEGKH